MAATRISTGDYRSRLLEGMANAVAAKGYPFTTIADVVREAGVSRRTFYELYPNKLDCFIALYAAASHNALKVLRGGITPGSDWPAQVDQALVAYFTALAQNPQLMRTLFVEILGLGDVGLAARRRTNQALADFMLEVVNSGRAGDPPLSAAMASAAVGGINELLLKAIEDGRIASLPALAPTAGKLVRAVARAERSD